MAAPPTPTPLQFITKGEFGDFVWMIKQPTYNNTLFIFGDRIELLNSTAIGNGLSWIRRYTKNNREMIKPLAANVPIGSLKRGGYSTLSSSTIQQIDASVAQIATLLATNTYDNVYYAADENGQIFIDNLNVSGDVRSYITNAIVNIGVGDP